MRALALVLLLLAGLARAEVAVPPVARVTDLAGVLSPEQRGGLESRLAEFEARKGSQVAVLTLPSTAPETIEQYAIRVAEAWRLGRKGIDDGAILVVATQDRALRLEVGYGLEGVIPDAIARRIVAETVTPYFQAGDLPGGIAAGVEQVLKVIDGEPLPPPRQKLPVTGSHLERLLTLGFVVLVVSQMFGRAIGKLPAAAGAGGVFGLITFVVVGAAGVALFAAAILAFVSLAFQAGGAGGRGWSSRGGFGGGGLGGGFGGGGFRGGGGGFGGGGASGRW